MICVSTRSVTHAIASAVKQALSRPDTRVIARLAPLCLIAALGACSSTTVNTSGEAVLALNKAEDHLSAGRAGQAVQAATLAIATAPDEAIRVRALVLRSRARLKLGELSMARIDARLAESALATAFPGDGGARGIWQAEVDKVVRAIQGGEQIARSPRPTPRAELPPWTPPARPSKTSNDKVAIESRARWHARPVRANRSAMTKIRRLTVHHTASRFDSTDYSQSAQRVLGVQRYHQDTKGWADIGYHYLVDRAGRIWEGRSIQYQGAHAGNASLNRGNVGVCLIGDFDKQKVSIAQRSGLIQLIGYLRDKYAIPASGVFTHQELKATACPGGSLSDVVDTYRSGGFSRFTP